jgi:predicted nucleic acid-binding Zn ribbon protein
VDHEDFEDDPDAPQAADIERLSDVIQKCPECGKDLYDDAEVCWNCGCVVSEARTRTARLPWWAVVAAIVALIGFLLYAL